MTSPYGPPGGNDPHPWDQQPGGQPPPGQPPYGGGYGAGTPGSYPPPGQGGYGQQPGGYDPSSGGQYGGYGPQPGQYGPYGAPQGGYGQQPGYPGGFGQQSPYGMPPVPTRRKRSLLPWAAVVLGVVVVALVLVLGFVTPGWFTKKVFDATAVQDGVKRVLSSYKIDTVSCPANQEVKANTTFVCTAMIAGAQKKVTITVKDNNGVYEVAPPTD